MNLHFLVLISSLLLSSGIYANENRIISIVKGQNGEPHLVKYSSGEVQFVEANEKFKLIELEQKLQLSPPSNNDESEKFFQIEADYEPTLVPDAEINNIFKNLNPYIKRKSECSDRAHVWAWDEFKRSGIKSEKAFLLLTDAYIRRTRFKWWFHVAPLFTTTSGAKIVMDYQFLDRPVTFTEWKNHLVFSKRECVKDFNFLDYNAGADQTQDCYVKFEPMYYYIPGDIGSRESGRPKTDWSASQVNTSRSRAFFKGSL